MYRKFNFQVLVPVGIDLELAFLDPLGIILNDTFDLKIVIDVEFFQSGPDCKKFVPSLGIEPDLAFEIIHGLGFDLDNVLPVLVVGQKQTIVFSRPSLAPIGPVSSHKVQYLP